MTANTLAEAITALPAYATDPFLQACVRPLAAGAEPQQVLVDTLNAFAQDRERLVRQCIHLQHAEIPVMFFGAR